MHRVTEMGTTGHRFALARRLGAVAALAVTPALGYTLGRLAWEQAQLLVSSAPLTSAFGFTALTLGQVLSLLAAAAGALVTVHLTWTTVVMLITPRRSRLRTATAALTPAAWRRLVAVATTGTLSLALAVPATASISPIAVDTTDAGWVAEPIPQATEVVTPETVDTATETADSTRAPDAAGKTTVAGDASSTDQVVVARGDTLWDITAAQLDLPTSDHGAIAAAWPELYDDNRHTIGEDPGLIIPGQQLTVPTEWTA